MSVTLPTLEDVQIWIKADKRKLDKRNYSAEQILECVVTAFTEDSIKYYEFATKLLADWIVSVIPLDVVHSVRYRIKEPSHLVNKLVRKCLGHDNKPARRITKDNLFNLDNGVTDLGGVRALHLYRHQWRAIHRHLNSKIPGFKLKQREAFIPLDEDIPSYNSRTKLEGFFKKEIFKRQDTQYISLHYTFEYDTPGPPIYIECQVRTLFEEGWGEIDHELHYPEKAHKVVGTQLKALHGATQVADKIAAGLGPLSLFLPWSTELKYERGASAVYVLSRDLAWAIDNIKDWRNNFCDCDTHYFYIVPDINDVELTSNIQTLLNEITSTNVSDRLKIIQVDADYFDAPFFSDVLLIEDTYDWKVNQVISLVVIGTPTRSGVHDVPNLDVVIRDPAHIERLRELIGRIISASGFDL